MKNIARDAANWLVGSHPGAGWSGILLDVDWITAVIEEAMYADRQHEGGLTYVPAWPKPKRK